MQQHPIPQNVMSVEFQLVGNLTLRQFGYLAIGAMITFLIYLLPLTDWLKWPLLLSVATFFAALTWLPVNDMGLDRWVVAFFRAINSPTKRIWRKDPKELAIFTRDFSEHLLRRSVNPPGVADRTKLNEYLATLRASAPKSDLDQAEASYLESLPFEEGGPPPQILAPLLGGQTVSLANEALPPATAAPTPAPAPAEVPEPRTIEEDLTKPSLLQPAIKPVITVHMPNKNIYVKKVSTTSVNRQLHSLSSLEGTIVLPVRGERTFEISEGLRNRLYPAQNIESVGQAGLNPAPPLQVPTAPSLAPLPPAQPAAEPAPKGPDLVYKAPAIPASPEGPATDVAAMEKKLAAEAEATRAALQQVQPKQEATTQAAPAPSPLKIEKENPAPAPQTSQPTSAPDRSQDKASLSTPAPKPSPSSGNVIGATPAVGKMAPPPANVPNVIVGLLRDQAGLLLTDVVIIVKDQEGEPVRALKSNKVGQFAISTPLPNGKYTIDLQKEGYKFDTIALDLEGQIFTPIEIKAN
ncbi:MAG TPA: PrgI family protein [Patescibacteria group bacterium]|nr:PrgI family protein [Patescibacteria group bacterium]